jgi:hypothetical protein
VPAGHRIRDACLSHSPTYIYCAWKSPMKTEDLSIQKKPHHNAQELIQCWRTSSRVPNLKGKSAAKNPCIRGGDIGITVIELGKLPKSWSLGHLHLKITIGDRRTVSYSTTITKGVIASICQFSLFVFGDPRMIFSALLIFQWIRRGSEVRFTNKSHGNVKLSGGFKVTDIVLSRGNPWFIRPLGFTLFSDAAPTNPIPSKTPIFQNTTWLPRIPG